jgi:hypothetical protein
MLEALAQIFSDIGLWLLVWVAALGGFSVFLLRRASTPKKPRPWVVRQGECPFCGSELFGATREYQRLYLLETLPIESKYLCTSCDRERVADLLGKYRLGLPDD